MPWSSTLVWSVCTRLFFIEDSLSHDSCATYYSEKGGKKKKEKRGGQHMNMVSFIIGDAASCMAQERGRRVLAGPIAGHGDYIDDAILCDGAINHRFVSPSVSPSFSIFLQQGGRKRTYIGTRESRSLHRDHLFVTSRAFQVEMISSVGCHVAKHGAGVRYATDKRLGHDWGREGGIELSWRSGPDRKGGGVLEICAHRQQDRDRNGPR